MWHGYGYFEGEHLGRPYDLRLLVRLLTYARPYALLLVLANLLILGATAADLVLPYLTKVAIDRYIVVSAQEVIWDEEADPEALQTLERCRHLLQPTGRPGHFFLPAEKIHDLDPADLARLRKAGLIRPEHYYLVDPGEEETAEIIARRPELFRQYPRVSAIPTQDLAQLKRQELARLRADDLAGLLGVALVAVVVLVIGYLFNFSQVMLLEYAGQRLTHDLRQKLLGHVLAQSLSFHDQSPLGQLVARLTNDIQNLSEMIKSVAVTLFKDAFILLGIVVLLLYINTPLALVTFTLLPPMVVVTLIFRRRARDVFRDLRRKVAQINSAFSETISGVRILQAFCREEKSQRDFGELNHQNYLAGMKQIRVFAVFMPLIELISATALGLVIWYGGWSVIREVMTLGAVVAFIGYVQKFFQPIRDLAEKYNILQSAMASLERIFGLLEQRSTLPAPASPRPLPPLQGAIEFEAVDFAYRPGEPVLRGVSFRVEPGQTLAIVGATGAGKTSLINLLLRFYDVTRGRILVDGVDVREVDLAAHRRRFGLVMQDPFLFSGSVRENIALARPEIGPAEIKAAARRAEAAEFIEALPGGYDQRLGEGGLTLSVGQRQLLSLARALAQDPPVLVLDEATASIDAETEKRIETALRRLTAGRTSIIIAHRLSTIQRADKILALADGRVAEVGTQAELLARRGLYYRMHQLSFREEELALASAADHNPGGVSPEEG